LRSIGRRIRARETPRSALRRVLASLALLACSGQAWADASACAGRPILDEIKRDRPTVWAKAEKDFSAVPNSSGVFWRISKPGVPDSWLLGTMHVPDARILSLTPAVAAAFQKATTVTLESTEILAASPLELAARMADMTRLADDQSFDGRFTPEQKAALGEMTEAIGIPYFAARHLKPWFLAMSLSIPPCVQRAELRGEPPLDKKLYDDAKAAGKKLVGLESADEQLATMRSFDKADDVQQLLDLVSIGMPRLENLFLSDIELYLEDRPAFSLYLGEAMPEFKVEADNYNLVEGSLVHDRNLRMRDRLLPILAEGGVFVAVGALHLIDKDGLVELLRQSGYEVSLVP
jgi:uncharacterized protein YbaP (TraB family)